MTRLPELLRDLADEAPAMTVPSGLFDRARRRRRVRWAMAATAVVVLLLSGYGVSLAGLGADRDSAQIAAGSPGLPDTVFDPPQWTQPFDGSPNGPASVVFWGPAVPDQGFAGGAYSPAPTAVVGLSRDTYRVVYPAQPSLMLSPDGTTLLVARQSGQTYRTDAVNLATGRTRPIAAGRMPIGWSADGRYALVGITDRWSHPDADVASINDLTIDVLAWPSGHVEWSVRIARPDAIEGESNYLVALSPDASMLATSTSHQLRVYRRDGTQLWHQPLTGFDILAGPAAWRPDGRLAVLRRSTCAGCRAQVGWSDPSDWRLTYVDAATGDPLPDPGYSHVSRAFSFSVIAWRADTAYAVVRANRDGNPEETQARLVRLGPDGAPPRDVITMPRGTGDLTVATDYLDTIRPAGSPEFGFSLKQVAGMVVPYAQLLVLVVVIGLVVWWVRRNRTRLRPVPPAP
jgi:hypothetical protein